jgi:uncharacterized protein YegJ (DUF2314 family)
MSSPNEPSPFEMEVVLLQEGWWDLSGDILQDIVRRAFRKKIRVSDVEDKKRKKKPQGEDSDWIVAGFPMFSVNYRGVLFMIFTIPEPFFPDREAAADSMNELRLAKAVRAHETHITIKMMNNGSDLDEEGRQRLLGRFLAYFTWYPHTRAVFLPDKQLGRAWDKSLRRALRDRPAMEALLHAPGRQDPVSRVMPSDEEIQQATAEARRRWPEFVAAFAHRVEGQEFFVKAPFKDGDNLEHMWTQVVALEDDFVVGKILNEPVDVTKFKKGTKVRFRSKILSDWFYGSKGKEIVGMFVEDLIRRKHNEEIEQRLGIEDDDNFDEEDEAPPPAAPAEVRVQNRPAARPAALAEPRPKQFRAAPAEPPTARGLSPLLIGAVCVVVLLCVGAVAFMIYQLTRGTEEPNPVAQGGPPNPRPGPANPPPDFQPQAQPQQLQPQPQQPPQQPPVQPRPQQPPPAPPRRGGVSGEHITRNFLEALQRDDLKAAYECLSTPLQQREPFAKFEQAVRDHKILDGPRPLRQKPAGKDAQGQPVLAAYFFRLTRDLPPLFTVTCRPSDSGWWIEALTWTPGAADKALAGLPKGLKPKERGGNSDEHILREFLKAIQNKDLRAAYDCTTLEFQRRQSFADFEKALNDNKVWDGPLPLSLRGGGLDAQRRNVAEIYFARSPFNRRPLLRAACVPDDTGWWIDALTWTPGVVDQALAEKKLGRPE